MSNREKTQREVLFKAQRLDGRWCEGFYYNTGSCEVKPRHYMLIEGDTCLDAVPIDPSTLCQFTGLEDKNGVRIFEGDRCLLKYEQKKYELIVKYNSCKFLEYCLVDDNGNHFSLSEERDIEVLGNIHDKGEV